MNLLPVLLAAAICTTPPMWDYCPDSPIGPAHWGEVPGWQACGEISTVFNQSPIVVPSTRTAMTNLGPLKMVYKTMPLTVTNTTHAIKIPVPDGYDEYFLLGPSEVRFDLKEFHFHVPAEHQNVPGVTNAVAELHLVHVDKDGNSAAIGIMLVPSVNDADNPLLEPIIASVARTVLCEGTRNGDVQLRELTGNAEPRTFTSYEGSLTTPNCSRVRWFLVPNTIPISRQQLKELNVFGRNARPIQTMRLPTYCWPADNTTCR